MKVNASQKVVLAISGFDPSGGAGTLADIKTISAFGCYGVAAITSLTFQNTEGVFGSVHQDAKTLGQQIRPLLDDFEVASIKTGMLGTADAVIEISEIFSRSNKPIVVDPVLISTSGDELMQESALKALRNSLFPLATVVTPNRFEAEKLTGLIINEQLSLRRAASQILEMGARAVIVTGGDDEEEDAGDFLLDSEGEQMFVSRRVRSRNTHGTGCSFSSALACLLAQGVLLRDAIPVAKEYIRLAILSAPELGRGHGPLNHFPSGFAQDTECTLE